MSLGALNIALSGLRVAQQQLDVISNNVANVGTEGYTRKILPQETLVLNGDGLGVLSSPTIRKIDLNLERDFWVQVSATEFYTTKTRYLNQIQEYHGPPESELSIASNVSQLQDAFSALADAPEDIFLLQSAVDQASAVADKFNEFSALITQLRNDAQDEISATIAEANSLLEQIADLNSQILSNLNIGKTVAGLEDLRDQTVRELANMLEISFFIRGDGVMVVQTDRGEQLADESAETLVFDPSPLGAQSFFPSSAAGLTIRDPNEDPTALDLTESDLGGTLGALFDLRDETFPSFMAQLDELAHKMAQRFDQQGLRLFTDASGQVPADTDPVAYIPPGPPAFPGTAVEYVGFSAEIQVNESILNDNTLLRTGTVATDLTVQTSSNEVIRRVVEFVFGDVHYEQADGIVDLRAAGAGGVTMQEWLGVFSENRMVGITDVSQFADVNSLLAAGGDVFVPPAAPITDSFTITIEDPRVPVVGPDVNTFTVTVSLNNAALQAGANAAEQIAAEINAQVALALAGPPPVSALLAPTANIASVSTSGELILDTRGNITIDATFAGGMGEDGLDFLGLEEGTFSTTDPYFDVQVGNDPSVRITIEPGEDENDLLDKLVLDPTIPGDTGVPGLAVDDVTLLGGPGTLHLRPGDDYANPLFGGDLKLVGRPFTADGTGGSGALAGATMIQALFGAGDPVSSVAHDPFKENNLGASVDVNTSIIGSPNLIDFGQKLVNQQTNEVRLSEARGADEETFRDLLGRQLLDESGVNLDEEMSHLIIVQTAYAAAARALQAIDETFQELLNSV